MICIFYKFEQKNGILRTLELSLYKDIMYQTISFYKQFQINERFFNGTENESVLLTVEI